MSALTVGRPGGDSQGLSSVFAVALDDGLAGAYFGVSADLTISLRALDKFS
jgi:hypothetical protein